MYLLKVGTVLLQETSDEILMDLEGHTQAINQHTEHWLIEDIKLGKYKLYNLDTKRVWIIPHKELELMVRGNKRYNIKPMFTISDEVA